MAISQQQTNIFFSSNGGAISIYGNDNLTQVLPFDLDGAAHQTILDPTGAYILVPDIKADIVRVYYIDPDLNLLMPWTQEPLKMLPGFGPRHAVFWSPKSDSGEIFLHVVGEYENSIDSFRVTYPDEAGGDLAFEKVGSTSTFGPNGRPPGSEIFAAEIAISPDNRFIVVSNRGDQSFVSFDLPSLDEVLPPGSPVVKNADSSDSLASFEAQPDGSLKFMELSAAGGSFPRSFEFAPSGDMVAVGLQKSGRVVILKRDVESGKIGEALTRVEGLGNVTCITWGL